MSRRPVAPALLFVLCCSLSALTVGAQTATPKPSTKPPGSFVVIQRLKISVVEAESGRPVPKAKVTIRRAGRSVSGAPLGDFAGLTDDAGDFVRGETDFQLGGEPHRLEVIAPGYEELKLQLPDSALREAAGNGRSLVMSVALSRNAPPLVSAPAVKPGNVNANVNGANDTLPPSESRGFLANAASFLLFYFNKALWWLGLASVVVLTVYGAAWFLSYDIAFGRGPDPRIDGTPDYLRMIEIRLKEVQHSLQRSTPASAPHPDVGSDEHVKRMEALLERFENLASRTRGVAHVADDATSHQTSESLSRLEQQFAGKLGRLSDAVKEIHGLVSTLLVEARWGQDGHVPDSTPGVLREPERARAQRPEESRRAGSQSHSQEDESIKQLFKDAFRELYGQADLRTRDNRPASQLTAAPTAQGGWPRAGGGDRAAKPLHPLATPRPQPQAERARHLYRNLLDGQPSSPEPLHLDLEGVRSASGKLEDSSVYFMQVGHTQGTFVLFTEDGKAGYVFPNPALAFQGPALREVFPALTEAEFNGAKQRIEPVPVIRVGERKWKVDVRILEL